MSPEKDTKAKSVVNSFTEKESRILIMKKLNCAL